LIEWISSSYVYAVFNCLRCVYGTFFFEIELIIILVLFG